MKKLTYLIIAVIAIYVNSPQSGLDLASINFNSKSPGGRLTSAFENRSSDLQVQGSGVVQRVLSDDNRGSRHQRFILEVEDGLSVLVAHNIDLAPKIPNLKKGDFVEFYGEYEWNQKGGVIHWTHRDPGGRHEHGWLRRLGKVYQ